MSRSAVILTILIAVAVVRICCTYSTFSAVYDEGSHIAAGTEWLDRGTYHYEYQHPPLARVAVALGPYLRGLRTPGMNQLEDECKILYFRGQYWGDLTAARMGTLPFLVLAAIVVFMWGKRWFSEATGLWAALLFLALPPILAHSGLATLDIACAAMLSAALYQMMRWMETPTIARAIRLGLTVGLAVGTKFSVIPFLGGCGIALLLCLGVTDRKVLASNGNYHDRLWQIAIACLMTFLMLWTIYRFTLQPLPLTEFVKGIRSVIGHNRLGSPTYLLGAVNQIGWWYFFPVVLAVKTPLGFLLLAGCGVTAVCYRFRSHPWQQQVTVLFPLAILLICISSWINLGVRHILSIYIPLSILAGDVLAASWEKVRCRKLAASPIWIMPVLLAAWVCTDSFLAHPDYLAYFNPIAGSHPEKILAESDLDWGQDLHRLSVRLKELGVQEVSLAYFGEALLDKAELPVVHPLHRRQPAHGWIAVSVRYLTLEYGWDESYAWLKRETPLEIVGKSIWLYHLP